MRRRVGREGRAGVGGVHVGVERRGEARRRPLALRSRHRQRRALAACRRRQRRRARRVRRGGGKIGPGACRGRPDLMPAGRCVRRGGGARRKARGLRPRARLRVARRGARCPSDRSGAGRRSRVRRRSKKTRLLRSYSARESPCVKCNLPTVRANSRCALGGGRTVGTARCQRRPRNRMSSRSSRIPSQYAHASAGVCSTNRSGVCACERYGLV